MPTALVLFLGVLLIGAVSYGGAMFWQSADGVTEAAETAGSRRIITFSLDEEGSLPLAMEPPMADADSLSSPQDAGRSEPDAAESEPDEPTPYTVDGQVPASQMVGNSYFDDAIFFGDSITTGISGYHIADKAACIAAIGVSPHTAASGKIIGASEEKQTMLEAALGEGERSKVYIMLGGNALWLDKTTFADGYQEFIDAVKEQYPNATIYIQSMTPVTADVYLEYPDVSNEKIIEYNIEIAALAAKNKLPFVNVFEGLAGPDGYLPDIASGDGMHLSPEYYYKWFDYLKTHTVA